MEWVLLWIGLSIALGWAASQKGRSAVGYFLLSILLSPLVAIIVLLIVPARPRGEPGSGFTVCGSCRRAYSTALGPRCPHCSFLPFGASAEKKCPACAETILAEARKCKHCGEVLVA